MYSKVNNGVSERGSDDISQLSASVTGEKEVRVQSCVARIFRPIHLLHLAALLIICVFFLLDYTDGNLFYKKMAIMSLMSPLGALSRWKLSRWNSAKHPKIHSKHWPWLPWGTLLANLTGAILSIACQGLLDRYGHTWSDWANALLFAVKVGFAGGLSTVSTFVKEVVSIEEKYPGHAKPFIYATLTCIGGTVVGLIVYMPIVRL
jgi:fluoride ion exporter CrcB/FEX